MKGLLALFWAVAAFGDTIGTSVAFTRGCPGFTDGASGVQSASIGGTCDMRPEDPGRWFMTYNVEATAAQSDLSVTTVHYNWGGEFGVAEASAWYETTLTVGSQRDEEVFLSYDVMYSGYHSYHPDGWSTPTATFGGSVADLAQIFMGVGYGEGVLIRQDDPIAVRTNQGFLFRGQLDLIAIDMMPSASVRAQLLGIRARDANGNDVPISVQWGQITQAQRLQLDSAEAVHAPEPSTWFLVIAGVTALWLRRLSSRRGLGWTRAIGR